MSTLITGFPGFIGKRLVKALLEADAETDIVTLVEPRMAGAARSAASEIDGSRIEVVEGDITEERLGLNEDLHRKLTSEVTVLYHLAAIYDLSVPKELAQKVNVDGTGNVLDFCSSCDALERHNYVSTAYVAGDRTGRIYEHELALGQGHKNHYESTKFQAEVWVRERMDEVPTTIFRPAIVVGDSGTGETQKFDGPYFALRFISASLERGTPVANIGSAEAPFNVVPVDFVVRTLVEMGADPEAVGHTLHLCDPDPLSSEELLDLLTRLYSGSETSYNLPPKLVDLTMRSKKVQELAGGVPHESIRYLNHPALYDTRQATRLLGARGLRVPEISEYAPTMVEFFKAHEDDESFRPG
ncbi:MAG: SDR family oxidoreductase [Solirubrobacterales bacterium]